MFFFNFSFIVCQFGWYALEMGDRYEVRFLEETVSTILDQTIFDWNVYTGCNFRRIWGDMYMRLSMSVKI